MEISDLQVRVGGSPVGTHDWAWLQSRLRRPPKERQESAARLGDLLFGLPLDAREMVEYRLKLANVLDLIDDLEKPLEPLPKGAAIPREKRTFSLGSIGWQPCQMTTGEAYAATPTQVFQRRKLTRLHQFLGREGELSVSRQAIKVACGNQVRSMGADEVMLTPGAIQELQNPSCPPVTFLRLPPRVHKQVDILKASVHGVKRAV